MRDALATAALRALRTEPSLPLERSLRALCLLGIDIDIRLWSRHDRHEGACRVTQTSDAEQHAEILKARDVLRRRMARPMAAFVRAAAAMGYGTMTADGPVFVFTVPSARYRRARRRLRRLSASIYRTYGVRIPVRVAVAP